MKKKKDHGRNDVPPVKWTAQKNKNLRFAQLSVKRIVQLKYSNLEAQSRRCVTCTPAAVDLQFYFSKSSKLFLGDALQSLFSFLYYKSNYYGTDQSRRSLFSRVRSAASTSRLVERSASRSARPVSCASVLRCLQSNTASATVTLPSRFTSPGLSSGN